MTNLRFLLLLVGLLVFYPLCTPANVLTGFLFIITFFACVPVVVLCCVGGMGDTSAWDTLTYNIDPEGFWKDFKKGLFNHE